MITLGDDRSAISVMFVDDESDVCEMSKMWFTRFGYNITVASSASEALCALHNGECSPNVIVSDIVMPGMNGMEFVKRVRADLGQVPFIMVSGWAVQSTIEFQDGPMFFLQKPYRLAQLRELVDKVVSTADDPRAQGMGLQQHAMDPLPCDIIPRERYG
jgi:DNA-binding NtrC family response regulator